MKKYAIELLFDEESQKKINEIRNVLVKNGIPDKAVPNNHISAADFETEDLQGLKTKIDAFASRIRKFKIALASVGSFMTRENVLFLAPIMTEELINVHKILADVTTDFNGRPNPYYMRDKWVPHCTIAINLSDTELYGAIKVLKSTIKLPIEVTVDRVDILRHPEPYVQEYVLSLD